MKPAIPAGESTPVAWALALVFVMLLLGNNVFTKITLLACLVYFGFRNISALYAIALSLRQAPWLVLFQLWAAASLLWSVVPLVTLDIVATQGAFFILCILMARYSIGKDIGASLKLAACAVILLAAVFVLVFPGAASSPHGIKAFYGSKNGLGAAMAICMIAILFSSPRKWFDYPIAAMGLSLLVLSRSKTSISTLIAVVVVLLLAAWARKLHGHASDYMKGFVRLLGNGLSALLYALVALGVIFREQIADFLIKNLPYQFMTGRGELWIAVLRRTEFDLLRGIGPGSFWGAGRMSEIAQTSLLTKYPQWIEKLGSADGGYIDLVGALGFIGLALLLFSLIGNYRRLVRLPATRTTGLLAALVTFFLLHNVSETTAYHSTNSLWFLYLYTSFVIVFAGERQAEQEKATGLVLPGESATRRYVT